MRKSDIRKCVHGILDLLPLLVIPVFMVYSHRHTIESNSVTIAQNSIVEMKQGVLNGKPNNLNNLIYDPDDIFLDINDNYLEITSQVPDFITLTFESELKVNSNDYLYITITSSNEYDIEISLYLDESENELVFEDYLFNGKVSLRYRVTNSLSNIKPHFNIDFTNDDTYFIKDFMICNLTTMYGSGNEPSIEQFVNTWKQDYYTVDSHAKALAKGTSTVTYNDTDIGSQFVYSLYNVTNNYFNFNNVFGFGNLQDWFLLNIFGGNAPLAFYIVWQVVLYEFLMDLIFLIYGLFMWFIDMCEKLMNKPLNAIK